jgi:hypothetical protein
MRHWLEKVVVLLQAETADLRQLAVLAGGDPRTFYRGVKAGTLDISNQDIHGMQFSESADRYLVKIKKAVHGEERVAMVLAYLMHDRDDGLNVLSSYREDRSHTVMRAIALLNEEIDTEASGFGLHPTLSQERECIALIRSVLRFYSKTMRESRHNIFYYIVKLLSDYPEANEYLRRRYVKSTQSSYQYAGDLRGFGGSSRPYNYRGEIETRLFPGVRTVSKPV